MITKKLNNSLSRYLHDDFCKSNLIQVPYDNYGSDDRYIALLTFSFYVSEVISKKVFVSLDGHDREECGYFAAPCASIQYAITKRSTRGDNIKVDGTKGKKRDTYRELEISLKYMIITVEGFNGKPVIQCKPSRVVFWLNNSRVNFKNLEFEFYLSDSAPERRKVGLAKTIAILAHNSSVNISNCLFNGVPVAFQSFCIASCTNNVTDNIFQSQHDAVLIKDIGGHGLNSNFFSRNKFIGRSKFSVTALHFVSHFKYSKQNWTIYIDSCIFSHFVTAVHSSIKGDIILRISNSEFQQNRFFSIHVRSASVVWINDISSLNEDQIRIFIIVNCKFVDNTGYQGGAINIASFIRRRNQNSSLERRYSKFQIQTSGTFRPGSTLMSRKVKSIRENQSRSVMIINCKFINNTSYRGGAINFVSNVNRDMKYTIHATLKICNSTFCGNNAFLAGGAISARGGFETYIQQCTFMHNVCGSSKFPDIFRKRSHRSIIFGNGGAIFITDSFKASQAFVQNCIFKNNTAEFSGGSLYSDKVMDLLNIYIESAEHIGDSSVWTSTISAISRLVLQNVTIRVMNTASNRIVAHFGTEHCASQIDANSKFVCPIGSILKYVPCSIEHAHRRSFSIFLFYCKVCPPAFYSLHESILHNRTKTNTNCMRCSSGGRCRSGIITAKGNFWGSKDVNTDRIKFIQLPRGYGCSGTECVSYDACAINRQGPLCGTCSNGYSESILSSKCIANTKCQRARFWLMTFILLVLFLIFILYKQEIAKSFKSQFRLPRKQQQTNYDKRGVALIANDIYVSCEEYIRSPYYAQSEEHSSMIVNRHEQDDSAFVIGFMKIIFYFYQIENILHAYSNEYGDHAIQKLRNSVSSFFNFEFSVNHHSSFTCVLFDVTPIWKVVVRIIFVAMVFLVLLICLIFMKIYQRIRENFIQLSASHSIVEKGIRFSDRFLVTIFEIILLSYAVITKSVFTLLTCVFVEDKKVLFIQGSIKCYQSWQYSLMGVGLCWVIPFCLFVILLPAQLQKRTISKRGVFVGSTFPLLFLLHTSLVRCVSKQQPEQQNPHRVTNSILKLLSGPFKSKRKHQIRWEGVYLLRRLILVSVNSFIQDEMYKLYSMLLIQILFLLHHVHMRPFKNKLLNTIETISLTILIMLNSVKTFAVYDTKHGLHEEGPDLLLLKIFTWTELVLVLFAPLVTFLLAAVLIIVNTFITTFKTLRYLYRWVVRFAE